MFGLSFANPAMLYGLWAALLPLAIHLLNRRRSVTLPFSNVALLQALQHDRMRQVKLKQILLLILRTLLIILLVLAFARPTLTGTGAADGAGDAGTAAVILLDRSLSMQYRTPEGTLFERGKSRVREILSLFKVQDDVQVMLVDQDVELIAGSSLANLRARVDGWEPAYGRADFLPALLDARAYLMASQMPNRELYVVSDLARLGWSAVPDTLSWADISVYLVSERPEAVQNVGVTQVKTVGGLLRVGQPATLEIELLNDGDSPKGDIPVQAFWGERRIVQQVAHIPAGERQTLYARFTPESGGTHALRVEIGDDPLPADNARVSVVHVPDQLQVLLIGENDQDTYFLLQALQAASFGVDIASPQRVTDSQIQDADVIYLCHVRQVSTPVLDRLSRHVSDGGGLGLVLGTGVDMRYYNERLLPTLLPSTLISVKGRPGATTAYEAFPAELPDHPFLSSMALQGTFRSPRLYAYYGVRPDGDTQTLLSLANGAPALLEAQKGQGRVVLFVSEWGGRLTWNDMPVSGFFMPFVYNLTGYLVAGAAQRADYTVGTTVVRPIRQKTDKEGVLRPPGEAVLTLWPQQRGVQAVWPVGRVDTPGLWQIYAQAQQVDQFAVQLDPDASNLTRISDAELQARFLQAQLVMAPPEGQLKDVVLPLRHGREYWRLILGGALFVMLLEMWIAKTARSSRRQEEEYV